MARDNIEVLYTEAKATPEQVMLDIRNDLEGVTDFAIVYKGKDGHYHSTITEMPLQELLTLSVILRRRAERWLTGGEHDED